MEKELKALRIDRSKKGTAPGSSRTWLLILLAFFVGAVLMALLFQTVLAPDEASLRAAADSADPSAPASTDGAPVVEKPDPDAPVLIASGYIVPHHRIEVGSKIVGKVAWVGVEKSDKVKQGQLLVKLVDAEFQAQLAQAEATHRSARARLAELEAGSRPEEIERAQAELERAHADLRNAELEHERLSGLLQTGVVSKQQVDNSWSRLEMARAAVGVAEKNLSLARLGPRSEQIEVARAEVERSRAAVSYWQTQLRETEIRAPTGGTVLERVVEEGEMVSTAFAGGAVLVALADLSDLQVELDISQSDFKNISADNRCKMSPVAYPEREYTCEIAEIAPEANRQRATIQVKVQILEPDGYLRPEMDAQVTFYRNVE